MSAPDERKPEQALPAEDDDTCDLDPTKTCDNCMKCVLGDTDYSAVTITGIRLENEQD